jgi:glycosyltransferase involved in cell wall biosynthesis
LISPFVKSETPGVPVTAFLGAYSIVKRIPSGARVLCGADALTTHFDGHVSALRDGWLRRRRPIALIYRGVDLEPLKEIRPTVSRKPRLVIVSRLAANKTVEDGVRAFALIRRTHPEASLDVIGDGPCRKSLERLACELGIGDGVVFRGLLPQNQAFAIVAGATALIMPSLSPYDFYPNAVKEAMALGVPCAGYAIPGVAGFDGTGHAVRLASPGCVEDLARITNDLIENPGLARETAAAARIRVRDFDIRATSARQAELFRALIARAPLPAWVLQPTES